LASGKPARGKKRRTREHVIADLSVNHVERYALLCGFSVEPVRMDYGIDLIVHTFNRKGEFENGRLLFQLKATDRLKVSADGQTVACRIERSDLRYWLREPMPVILVLYDARANVAYWLNVQTHFRARRGFELSQVGEMVTVAIPRINVLDRAAMNSIARYKKAILNQLEGHIYHAD
jgi:hypothetical protein